MHVLVKTDAFMFDFSTCRGDKHSMKEETLRTCNEVDILSSKYDASFKITENYDINNRALRIHAELQTYFTLTKKSFKISIFIIPELKKSVN